MRNKNVLKSSLFFFLAIISGSCTDNWSISVQAPDKELFLKKDMIEAYQYLKVEESTCNGVPLEIALYQNGINTIDRIEVHDSYQNTRSYEWASIAEDTCVTENGEIEIGNELIETDLITVIPSEFNNLDGSLLDIFPTVMAALDVKVEDNSFKKPLIDYKTDHVVLIFLDGLNNDHFNTATENGWLTAFEKSEYSSPVLSVYPPRTTTASAAIITGKAPLDNGVYKAGIRRTSEKTIFDYATENKYSSVSVEGESVPFNLGGSEIVLSGDRDSNGGTDDNVFANVISILEQSNPNLFYIHFHGIDDIGHAYGPYSEMVWEKIREINGYLNEIIQRLPQRTLVITFADHGMHEVADEKDKGNHGNLIDEDMVVFINIFIK